MLRHLPNAADDIPTRDERSRATTARRVRAYARVMPDRAFVTGMTAMAMFGAPLDDDFDPEGDLQVGIRAPHRAPRGRGIRGTKVSPNLVRTVEVGGIRSSSPAATWALLANELTVRRLVILGDFLVRVPRGEGGTPMPARQLATVDQLRAAALAPGRRGRSILLLALSQVRVGSMSPLETDCRRDVLSRIPLDAEIDVEIRDSGGRLLGIVDQAYLLYRVAIEVEGDHHRTSRAQWDRDIRKHADLTAHGWEVVRLTARHIRGDPAQAAARIRAVLRRRGWDPSDASAPR